MNKKINSFIALLMLISGFSIFASLGWGSLRSYSRESEKDKKIPAALTRYDTIANAYNAEKKAFNNNFLSDVKDDIEIVEEHKKLLQNELVKQQNLVSSLYAPGMFNAAGKVFAVAALAGGLASAAGALGASSILGGNEDWVTVPVDSDKSRRVWEKRPGATYLESLRGIYTGLLLGDSYVSPDLQSKMSVMRNFRSNFSSNSEFNLVSLGFLAPPIVLGSLVLAGISKYLLNKSASYTSEIARLEAEIKRDNEIIIALRAIQK